MWKLLLCLTLVLLPTPAQSWAQSARDAVEISVKHAGDKDEMLARDHLRRLLGQYDVSKWLFTKKVLIDRDAGVPHSHPVLTLDTGGLKDDELVLSTFVHEQIHWHLEAHGERTKKAMAELKTMYPDAPPGPPEGAMNLESTYRHLIVCYLEYQAIRELLGELRARQVIEFWETHHYKWVYRQVLNDERRLAAVVRKHGLRI